jgi:L-aspartate oxidase
MSQIVIIGGGMAGLMAALEAAPAPVILLDPALGLGAASMMSQGGLAAAMGGDDSVASHITDTLAAGAGLCDPASVQRIIGAAPSLAETLRRYGVRFDRNAQGGLALGREAAHSHARILHGNGDQTGAEIMRALLAAVRRTPSITLRAAAVRRILLHEGEVTGVLTEQGVLEADRVLLATGGIGGLFCHSTNPETSIGAGLMLAMAAGATLKNLEFIQFHPTALDTGGVSLPLISEAVRGEGAKLIDERGDAFMNGQDLAPRDVVARAIFAHQAAGHRVFLDARFLEQKFATRFPGITAICAQAGIDPARQPIPVRPAAHYHMGGVAVDFCGRTSVAGLFAAGEVACTGLHGANRLASNSLLEAGVCGAAAGKFMAGLTAKPARRLRDTAPPARVDAAAVRSTMSTHLGVIRRQTGLRQAITTLTPLVRLNAAASLACKIAEAALARHVSVGAHAMAAESALDHAA